MSAGAKEMRVKVEYRKLPPRPGADHQARLDPGQRFDLSIAEVRALLERKLRWYGLRSVKIGVIRRRNARTLHVDLLSGPGRVLCRAEVDGRTGAIRSVSRHVFSARTTCFGGVAFAGSKVEPPRERWPTTTVPQPAG